MSEPRIIAVSKKARIARVLQLLLGVVLIIVIERVSSSSSKEGGDAISVFWLCVLVGFVASQVARVTDTHEITSSKEVMGVLRYVAVVIPVLYLSVFAYLLAWKPEGISHSVRLLISQVFFPLTWVLDLMGFSTWLTLL